ncbi:MAG: restriction endonuclease subunit S, partial [Polaromonas sp.]|nr:restriction endonuclease subunit S [Polaromonas sp.]
SLGGWGMSFEWTNTTLAEFAEINPKRPIAKGTLASFVDMAALPAHSRDVSLTDVVQRPFTNGGAKFANGDTLVARITPCLENGKTAMVSGLPAGRNAHGSTEFIVLGPRSDDDRNFLYYLARSEDFRTYAISRMEGTSGRQRVPNSAVGQYAFSCPRKSVRKEIGNFLCALDDRITLLRETNATLEAIAQALFKSWFVDFDPVRAKMEGRAPESMDEATAALFPDGLEESALGLVPRGWRVGTLQDLLLLQRGFDLPSDDRVPGDFPIIAASGPSGTHNISIAKAPGVVTGRSGILGRVFLELDDYWPLNTTLWVREFRAATPCYAYELLRLLDLKSFNAGSAVPTLNRNHIHSLPYLVPPHNCVIAYELIAMQLHERARLNDEQSQTLATLRDTLLPRLISGQLRLPDLAAAEACNP